MFGELPADFRVGVFGDEPFDPKKLNPNQGLTPPVVTLPAKPIQVVTPPPSNLFVPPSPPRDPLAEKLAPARTFTGKRNRDWKPIIVPLGELVAGTPMPKLEMCLVPVGAFKMGGDRYDDEKPIHPQSITTPYWIARYTVTNAQWREGVQAGAVEEPEWTKWYDDSTMADCPVIAVNWHQALAFAQWARCTLPSELETEYAGRGVESWVYPWGNPYDAKRVVDEKDTTYGDKNPAPVTYKPEGASWVGAMQLSGNVWEWQRSLYKNYPYQAQDGRENVNENISESRVLRGGSFFNPAGFLRSAFRGYWNPSSGNNGIGFRCALSLNSSGL
jgi:formylglycine-generating enzyme required for sulfatase activity